MSITVNIDPKNIPSDKPMATFHRFEEIEAWKMARQLTSKIYSVSASGSFSNDYALRDQIRRAAISITANIAEGYERDSHSSFIHFLSIAKGSAGEVRSQIYVALDEGYIDQEQFDKLYDLATSTIRQISGLRSYLQKVHSTNHREVT